MICSKCGYLECSGGEPCASRAGTIAKGVHTDWCEGEPTHAGGCTAATKMARLRAFAEIVRDEFYCATPDAEQGTLPDDHVDDCWHHLALQALAEPGS